jgi:carboxyl-terminal processing protease
MSTPLKFVVGIALAVIIAAAGFIGGFATAGFAPAAVPSVSAKSPAVGSAVDTVNELLQDQALVPPSETSATAGAIQGLLESGGDKYALYFDQEQYGFFSEESMGEFGGIGVVLGDKEGSAYVVEVFEGTPAEAAGIEPEDQFVEIDGVRREKWTTEEVVKRVRGKEGTDVELTMVRPGEEGEPGEEYTATVTRAMIELPNIESELKGEVGYIRLAQFNSKSSEDIRAAISELEKQGARSFVLDLRDNPGGLLSEAVDVTSLFVESGVVVQVEERDQEPVQSRASGDTATDAPLVVLINENSASASEIVAGALQDYDRATLVGQKSFGKGSVQTVEELPASIGGAVKFTTAHYLTPKGRAIDGVGLTPDVVVDMDFHRQADEKEDVQLERALKIAREKR